MTDQLDGIRIDDCWNRIGLWAGPQRSCERLAEFVHCRNCPVYKSAGRELLERPVELVDAADLQVAEPRNLADTSYTCFRIHQEWFALPTDGVISVVDPLEVRKVPHLNRDVIEGICYYNGESLLAIDLAALISGLAQSKVSGSNKKSFARFMLLESPLGRLALRVSEVWGTQRCASGELKPLVTQQNDQASSLVRFRLDWQQQALSVIDDDALFRELERQL